MRSVTTPRLGRISTRHKQLVVLLAVAAVAFPFLAGAPAQSRPTVIASAAEAKTLYFHAGAPAAVVDELNEFASAGPGPFMDENPPTDPTPSVATNTGAGILNFRKNFLNAYWGAKVSGLVAVPTVSFWASSPALEAEVAIFGDGGIGAASPVARKRVPPAPALVSVTFDGLEIAVEKDLVVQISATLPPARNNVPAVILFDSPQFSSSMSFTLSPLPLLPKLDDPFGILHRTTELVIANSGTGHVLVGDLAGNIQSSLAGGLVPGGFARGVSHCSNWVAFTPCGRSLDGGDTWHPAGIAQAAGVADIYRAPDGSVFDFLDVVIDSSGRAWGTFVDACTGPCVGNRSASATDSKGGVAPLLTGPSLRGPGSWHRCRRDRIVSCGPSSRGLLVRGRCGEGAAERWKGESRWR